MQELTEYRGLTICGSLRRGSSNEALLETYRLLASDRLELKPLKGIESLPHFNPDLDEADLPKEVVSIRKSVQQADFLVFSTPEYIHAMPAVLKNLLEWLVGDPEFYGKPVVILHASPSSRFALESLTEVLTTMSATIIDEANTVLSLGNSQTRKEDILSNAQWVDAIHHSVSAVFDHFATKAELKLHD